MQNQAGRISGNSRAQKRAVIQNDCSFFVPWRGINCFRIRLSAFAIKSLFRPLTGVDYFQTHPNPMRILVCFRPLAGQ